MAIDTGAWTRQNIARDRARQASADADREERRAFHAKYGEREEGGAFCRCWGCKRPWRPGDGTGTEREGQE